MRDGHSTGRREPTTLAALCDAAELPPELRAELEGAASAREAVERLAAAEHYPEAVRLLALSLPPREAIWWGWSAAQRAAGEEPPTPVRAALRGVEAWLKHPTDGNRRPALELSQAAELSTPAGCIAFAVFFSGGSVAPPDLPEVPPAPDAAARAVAGGVILAAVVPDPASAPEVFQDVIAEGVKLADRRKAWPALATVPVGA